MPTSKTDTAVKLGSTTVNEAKCVAELEDLKAAIIAWAENHELWHDANFQTPFIYRDEAPERHIVLLLLFAGPLYHVFNCTYDECAGLYKEFDALLQEHGFWGELQNCYTLNIMPSDEQRADAYLALHRWQWIQHLAKGRLFDIHSEVFEHFAGYPDHLARLEWRQYEEFLDAVFRNQGFRTELGPGSNDGGIDVRLYQSASIPQMVTIVQAKKYAATRPIQLEAVAALYGHTVVAKASKGILATTSRFQPAAKKFALSVASRVGLPTLDLVDSQCIGGWCAEIAKELDGYFSSGATLSPPVITAEHRKGLTGSIVVARGGHDMAINYFAKIVADFPHEVILESLPSEEASGDGQTGTVVPNTHKGSGLRFTAFKRKRENGPLDYWGGGRLYSYWDGTPQHFDYRD